MTHPRQIPELAAHGGGGPKDGEHKRGLGPQGTPTAPYRPSPPGHLYLHHAEPGFNVTSGRGGSRAWKS